jgi:DUF438 domain-containing protein
MHVSELINNREQRIETLKGIIRSLHEGVDPESVKGHLREIVRQTTGAEIVAMEDQLIAEGMRPEEVKGMCDLHSRVLREIVGEAAPPSAAPGHPVDTFVRENAAIRQATARLRALLQETTDDAPLRGAPPSLEAWRLAARDLFDIEKHYARKENLLFSHLEKHGISGPSKVMWAKDDDVRKMIRALNEALASEGLTLEEWRKDAADFVLPTVAAIDEMIFKEEGILFPTSLDTLTAEEWGEIYRDTPRYGYCLAEPGTEYEPPKAESAAHAGTLPPGGAVVFPSGALGEEQLLALFSVLPVDITFVDAEDRVAFFSEGPDRVFARTRSIIGRKVQNCHPPSSVHIVDRILADFRSGAESVAEFWIELHGRFVHIRYFAVRSPRGEYLGTLEVTQDATKIRALRGERRLLQYGAA